MLHQQLQWLDRTVDKILPELKDLQRDQDGSEILALQLQRLTERLQNLTDRGAAFEELRDVAADAYRTHTGEIWHPRQGSYTSRSGALTSAAIDARDFIRARNARHTESHLPDGTIIAVAGGNTVKDGDRIWASLDSARAKYADMVLLHGGAHGAEKFAASWAAARGVQQIVCRPNWKAHGKAAPFRRNDELLNLLPKGIITFPGAGITGNLVDKVRQLGIPVHRVAAGALDVASGRKSRAPLLRKPPGRDGFEPGRHRPRTEPGIVGDRLARTFAAAGCVGVGGIGVGTNVA